MIPGPDGFRGHPQVQADWQAEASLHSQRAPQPQPHSQALAGSDWSAMARMSRV
jgi:hypothetical protein